MAKFVEWSDDLSVGIEEIDSQHKVLVDLVNQMHEAIHQRHGSDVVIDILNQLTDYTRIHFAVEESLMRILNYPGYEDHRDVHEELVQHIIEGVVRLALFLAYIWAIGFLEDIKRVFGYHGAEHKAINAYEQGVALIPEKVSQCSIVHPRCGTAFLLIVMVISIFVFALVGDPALWLKILSRIILIPAIAGIAYEFLKFSAAHQQNPIIKILIAPGLALQRMTTREPDLSMLEVSIAALKKLLAEEKLVAEAVGPVETSEQLTAPESASP